MATLDLVHASRNLEETRAFLTKKEIGLDLAPGATGQEYSAVIRANYYENFYISEIEYGPGTSIYTKSDPEYYLLSMMRHGAARAQLGQDEFACDGRNSVLQSIGQRSRMEGAPNARRLTVLVSPTAVSTHLARLAGEPVAGAVEFSPEVSLEHSTGRTLAAAVNLFAENASRPMTCEQAASAAGAFEDQLLSILLLYHPHSHSRLLNGGCRAPASRDVRRVIDFVMAHYADPIRLETLVRVAGVPGRTLNEHFRMFTGFSPMTFVRRERLKQARRFLLDEPHLSITEVAGRCGITHLGRFSVDYAQAFGESPSLTRQNGRYRRPA